MSSEHYFTATPASAEQLRELAVTLNGRNVVLKTASGIFSPDHIDSGTAVLLHHIPEPPTEGNILDLGCGWGPIALTAALQSPGALVWAIDVNERALELVRQNANILGIENVIAVRPDQVPDEIRFSSIRSNPPIRVGKNNLHDMLQRWVPRMLPGTDAWFVVSRNLGSDSLQKWLANTFTNGFSVSRAATSRGFRVLKVRRHSEIPTVAVSLVS